MKKSGIRCPMGRGQLNVKRKTIALKTSLNPTSNRYPARRFTKFLSLSILTGSFFTRENSHLLIKL
jgi:hypothetical protein